MALAKLMTNLFPEYYTYIRSEAKAQKKTLRQIIEEAIQVYKREKRKEQIRRDCARMAEDVEYLKESVELAEMGMVEYAKILENADKEV
ncbi:MAG: hypothetical protein Q8P95_00705 [bacterium]|nr:hypothetical protein [bacterium]